MRKTVVICAVGLTPDLIGPSTPRLQAWSQAGTVAPITEVTPAVTCTAHATYLTGVTPAEHGVVANGWYYRDTCEVRLWQQANTLVQAPKLWDRARDADPSFTVANMFWWFNMYSSVDYSVTPRPMYKADGRKLPDAYTHPVHLREELQAELGQFPLFRFWGPATSIVSTRWIADASMIIDQKADPTLTFIYLPHLDYGLQKVGPDHAAMASDLGELDTVCGDLIDHYEAAGARVVILSEYGITPVRRHVDINRVLRRAGLIGVRLEQGLEQLDAGASGAFAVSDHQIAHVYVKDRSRLQEVRELLEATDGIEHVLDEEGKRAWGLDHDRSGELVAISAADAWFTYRFWLDDAVAPDYARTVDIHRKPGYDPAEMFFDQRFRFPQLAAARRVLRNKLKIRGLMDVVSLDPSLVKGSHGRPVDDPRFGPLFITKDADLLDGPVTARGVHDLILRHLELDPATVGTGRQRA